MTDYTEAIKTNITLIKQIRTHREQTINHLINQHEGKALLSRLVKYANDLFMTDFKDFDQAWKDHMVRAYGYEKTHWDNLKGEPEMSHN